MAKHINAPFDTVAQPQARDISAAKPEITTMGNKGEPEKDFGARFAAPDFD